MRDVLAVILSAAKDLCGRLARSFAALRMTDRTLLESARGKLISKCLTGIFNGIEAFRYA